MTTDMAFRVLRDIQKFDVSSGNQELMSRAIDALQAAEVSRMMDRERGLNESLLKEAIKTKIKSLLSEGLMTTDDAFRALRTILSKLKSSDPIEYRGHIIQMEQALDALQAAEVSRMMDRERGLNESLNPEVTTAVNRFIKAMAKRYDYEEQDAVYAIMAALEQRKSDTKYDMPGFGDTMDALDDISIREEKKEMTDAEKKKAAEKDAKKEKIGKQASKLSQADEDRYERIKNGLEKLKKKGDEESIKKMKAILGKKDVEKLIKSKGRTKSSFM